MAIITISRGSYSKGKEVAEKVASHSSRVENSGDFRFSRPHTGRDETEKGFRRGGASPLVKG